MHNMRWADFEYVLAVAGSGSVAAAARVLGVNHTTVMRRVQAFEDQVNIKIFERLRSGYKTTPEGKMFLDAAASIETIISDLDRKIAGGDRSVAGTLSVTATDSVFPVIAANMNEFYNAHPNIVVDIVITNDRLDLDKRDADIAIRASINPPDHLVGRKACNVQFGIFATKKLAAETTLVQLEKRRWLGLEYPLTASVAGDWMDRQISPENIVMRSSSFVALCALAENGLGHVLLPTHLGDNSKQLVRVPNDYKLPAAGLWLLSHQDVLRSPRVRIGTDFLYRVLRSKRGAFEGTAIR